VPVLVLLAAPLSAQRAATSAVSIRIPTVSQLEVEADETSLESGEWAGVFRIRVRANHAWKLVLTASPDLGETIRVRVGGGSSPFLALAPGEEMAVTTGHRGRTMVEVEYRREGTAPTVASLPLVYTLTPAG
jgi:hypothetical protein